MKGPIAGVLVTLWALLIITLSFGEGMTHSISQLSSGSMKPMAAVLFGNSRPVGTMVDFPTISETLSQKEDSEVLFHPSPVSAAAAEVNDGVMGTSRLRIQEPATLVFLGIGFLVLAGYGRRLTHRTRK